MKRSDDTLSSNPVAAELVANTAQHATLADAEIPATTTDAENVTADATVAVENVNDIRAGQTNVKSGHVLQKVGWKPSKHLSLVKASAFA